jgi:hypothetical protein
MSLIDCTYELKGCQILFTTASTGRQTRQRKSAVTRTAKFIQRVPSGNDVLQLSAGNDVSRVGINGCRAVQALSIITFLLQCLSSTAVRLHTAFFFKLCDHTVGTVRVSTHITP